MAAQDEERLKAIIGFTDAGSPPKGSETVNEVISKKASYFEKIYKIDTFGDKLIKAYGEVADAYIALRSYGEVMDASPFNAASLGITQFKTSPTFSDYAAAAAAAAPKNNLDEAVTEVNEVNSVNKDALTKYNTLIRLLENTIPYKDRAIVTTDLLTKAINLIEKENAFTDFYGETEAYNNFKMANIAAKKTDNEGLREVVEEYKTQYKSTAKALLTSFFTYLESLPKSAIKKPIENEITEFAKRKELTDKLLNKDTVDKTINKTIESIKEFEKGLNPARYRILTAQDADKDLWQLLKSIIEDFTEENAGLKKRTADLVNSIGDIVSMGVSCKNDKTRYIDQFNSLLSATPGLEGFKAKIDCAAEAAAYKGEFADLEVEKRVREKKRGDLNKRIAELDAAINVLKATPITADGKTTYSKESIADAENKLVLEEADYNSQQKNEARTANDAAMNTIDEALINLRGKVTKAEIALKNAIKENDANKVNINEGLIADANTQIEREEKNLKIAKKDYEKLIQPLNDAKKLLADRQADLEAKKLEHAKIENELYTLTNQSGGAPLKKEDIEVLRGFVKELDDVKKLLRGMIETSASLTNEYTGFVKNVEEVSEIKDAAAEKEKKILGQSTYIDNEGAAFLKRFQETVDEQAKNLGPIMAKIFKVLDFDQTSKKFKDLRAKLKELIEGGAGYEAGKTKGLGLTIEYKKLVDAVTAAFNKYRDDTKKAAAGIRETKEQEAKAALAQAQAKAQAQPNPFYRTGGGNTISGGALPDNAITDQLTRIQADLKTIGTDIVDVLDKFLLVNIAEVGGPGGQASATGQVTIPSIFNTIYREYMDKREDNPELAAMELAEKVRANRLDPREMLTVTSSDRTIFIFLTLFIRLAALSLVEWMIEKGYLLNVGKVLAVYLAIYTAILAVFVALVNMDMYRMRIVFNYVNFHANAGRVLAHIAGLWIFAGLIYMIMWNINIPVALTMEVSVLTEEDQVNLMYRIEMLSMIIWSIMTTLAAFV